MLFAFEDPHANDLPGIVDAPCINQLPVRLRRNESIQVFDLASAVNKSMVCILKGGLADNNSRIIDGKSPGGAERRKCSQILQLSLAVANESVPTAILRV